MSDSPKLKVVDGHVYATSLDLAKHFHKSHKNVLRDIERIISDMSLLNSDESNDFSRLNFEPSNYKNPRGKTYPIFHLTRDGFAIVAMGFTGKEALAWKIAYINAFNEMESELRRRDARAGQIQQLSLFPDLQQTISEQRATISLTQAIGIIAYQGLNIPPITSNQLSRLMDKGIIEGCRENNRRVLFVDSFNAWLQHRRAA